jgi:peptide/nickel transport system permease protein
MYFCVIFAEFLSPYNPHKTSIEHIEAPPSRIHFFDEKGHFYFRPFIYGTQQKVNPETLAVTYETDTSKKYPIHFFIRGDSYKIWGWFAGNMHLFGIKNQRAKILLFGADPMGKDLFSQVIYGGRISMSIGLMGIAMSFILGIIIGGISGYYGGRIDLAIQRIIEFLISIPTLPLWMALSVALPRNWPITKTYFAIVMILAIVGWTGIARVVRGKFMAVKEEDFVMAAHLDGASPWRIIFKYLLPSFYSYLIASLTLSVPGMIIGETALSFIGLGMQAPAISWGVLLQQAQAVWVLAHAPWLLIPGAFVVIAILAFNFVGDGLRDAADPYTTV